MPQRRDQDPLDEATSRKTGNFLFDKPGKQDNGRPNIEESQYLDIRTDISTKEMMNALFNLRTMDEYFVTPRGSAGLVANVMERLAISSDRGGRREAVEILRRGMGKVQEIEVGSETYYRKDD